MTRVTARFVMSAAAADQCPPSRLPEACFLGRSNVGKSSLINALLGTKIALVSQEPGRTRLVNFFEVTRVPGGPEPELMVADLPGYGFARAPVAAVKAWRVLVDDYLQGRERLGLCVVLVDANVPPQQSDLNLLTYLTDLGKPLIVVATKVDRLKASRKVGMLRDLANALQQDLLPVSAKSGEGREELWAILRRRVMRRG
jgi:GTP-binding protein